MTAFPDLTDGRVLVVGTAPPTRCGLATYTHNVTNALATHGVDARILRVLDEDEPRSGEPTSVRGHWRRGNRSDVLAAAELANDHDVVLLQHEFGIYPGDDGAEVLDFIDGVDVPVVSVLHTILVEPDPRRRHIIDAIAERSDTLVVQGSTARDRLIDVHGIDPHQVDVIPHGASSRIGLSRPLHSSFPSLLTWGLIGPGKGIEHGITAVALLRAKGIDVEYVVSGATHPNVLRHSGDEYRHRLMALSRRLGVDDLVRFDGHYRSREEQDQLIRNASIVLLPYDSREQVTSGVLVEALAAGKPIVATSFPHARELADCGGIRVVDHERPEQIADAVHRIVRHHDVHDAMRNAAWVEGLRHDWNIVGRKFGESLRPSVVASLRSSDDSRSSSTFSEASVA